MTKPTEKRKGRKKPLPVIKKKTNKQLSALKTKFIEYYSNLPIQKLAAEYIGKCEDTITDWKKKDKRFSDRLLKAKSEWALKTSGKVKSAEWLLERIMKEHFAQQVNVEHGVSEELETELNRVRSWFPSSSGNK